MWIKKLCFTQRSTFHLLQFCTSNFQLRTMSVNVAEESTIPVKRALEDEEEVPSKVQKVDKKKRKNYAILMGYLGKNYCGMQKNPGVITVEETLLKVLLKCNLINEDAYNNLKEIRFQRAARTDKGVSAARQIINFYTSPQIQEMNLNEYLPEDIRIFSVRRVTRGFNSKNQCDGRTYRYVIPTYMFALKEHDLTWIEMQTEEEEVLKALASIDGKPYTEYRLSPDRLERINEIAKLFLGTHNFHNFTSKVKPLDPRASRYVTQFQCTKVFVNDGMEFAIIEVKGQSFLLHQIRKMVGALVGVARNYITEQDLLNYFKNERYVVPMVPSLGLVLYNIHYESYNKRYGSDGLHEELNWADKEEEIEKFWEEQILRHITETEMKERTSLIWLTTLRPRHYATWDDS